MAVRLSALRASRPLPPGRFLVLISVGGCRLQGHNEAGRIRSIEKSNDLMGKRTCDLPAFNMVPQPITLPPASLLLLFSLFNDIANNADYIPLDKREQ
jgi:hypothetical protein